MQVVNFSEMRKNMKEIMNTCCDNNDIVIVTRQKEAPVVMMPLSDYNAL
jgi:PHD/YefM family antitoxin component YafN of YafNO toxin-antitoxin module